MPESLYVHVRLHDRTQRISRYMSHELLAVCLTFSAYKHSALNKWRFHLIFYRFPTF